MLLGRFSQFFARGTPLELSRSATVQRSEERRVRGRRRGRQVLEGGVAGVVVGRGEAQLGVRDQRAPWQVDVGRRRRQELATSRLLACIYDALSAEKCLCANAFMSVSPSHHLVLLFSPLICSWCS